MGNFFCIFVLPQTISYKSPYVQILSKDTISLEILPICQWQNVDLPAKLT